MDKKQIKALLLGSKELRAKKRPKEIVIPTEVEQNMSHKILPGER